MSHNLQYSLLRPSILHILRAAGFQSARPSVIDTLTDIAARYLLQLASITANYSINNHDDLTANVTDVRMAMQSFGLLIPNLTASEEHWRELLRRKLFQYSKKNGLRSKEQRRRDDDDTRDVNDFINWIKEDRNFEIRRIAGSMDENIFEVEPLKAKEDYVEGITPLQINLCCNTD